MRQKIHGAVPITKDRSSQAPGSQPNLAPKLFNKNQSHALCLPLLSKAQQIIWVHSDELRIPEEKVAKLDEAFNRFPYLTQKQTISLALNCSLLPDQVRVWFMVQRLCYGISWDSKDIHEVRRKMFGRATLKILHECEKETAPKPEMSTEDEGDAKEEIATQRHSKTAMDGQMIDKNMQRRRKRKALKSIEKVPDVIVKKASLALWPDGETHKSCDESNSEVSPGPSTKQNNATLQKTKGDCGFAIPDESLDRSPSISFKSQFASLLLVKHEKEQMETNCQPLQKHMVTQGSQTCDLDVPKPKKKRLKKRRPLPRCTPKQFALMKMEFIKQQYPTDEQYKELSSLSGVPRYGLVQWFNDMRYFIKKGKPRWMSVEQHKTAVASVMREQFMRKKMQEN